MISNESVSSGQWVNKTISTDSHLSKTITWKQVAYDKAGNYNIYSNSFLVILDAVQIYTYSEINGTAVLPTSIQFYSESRSGQAVINSTTKVGTVSYSGLDNEKYIVTVSADGYYPRTSIVNVDLTTLSELNVYLIPTSESSTIFNKLKLVDRLQQFDNSDYIIRLDKPVGNSTVTVFKSYCDFNGIASTYLLADSQYILYVVSPKTTYSYGWLAPDPDGEIEIIISKIVLTDYHTDWLQLSYSSENNVSTVTYSSNESLANVQFLVSRDSVEVYNTSSSTDSGVFSYEMVEGGSYLTKIIIERADGEMYYYSWVVTVGQPSITMFPTSYPQWFKDIVIGVACVFVLLAFSSYRADIAAGLAVCIMGFSWWVGEFSANPLVIAVMALIAGSSFIKHQRKEERT